LDQSREDISGLAQFRVIPPAEKRPSKLLLLVEACTNRMSQRRFANSRQAVDPVYIPLVLLPRFIGCPAHDLFQDKFAGALHTLETLVIAGLDRFESGKQKVLLCTNLLRTNYRQVDTMRTHQYS